MAHRFQTEKTICCGDNTRTTTSPYKYPSHHSFFLSRHHSGHATPLDFSAGPCSRCNTRLLSGAELTRPTPSPLMTPICFRNQASMLSLTSPQISITGPLSLSRSLLVKRYMLFFSYNCRVSSIGLIVVENYDFVSPKVVSCCIECNLNIFVLFLGWRSQFRFQDLVG